jgi:hypothetical protein
MQRMAHGDDFRKDLCNALPKPWMRDHSFNVSDKTPEVMLVGCDGRDAAGSAVVIAAKKMSRCPRGGLGSINAEKR